VSGPSRRRIALVFGAAAAGLLLAVGGLLGWLWWQAQVAAVLSAAGWALLLWAVVQQ
jgi:predicted negative regulator of RcsB-dependent stress response